MRWTPYLFMRNVGDARVFTLTSPSLCASAVLFAKTYSRASQCAFHACCKQIVEANKQAILKGLIDLSTIVRDNPQSANP
jgi:hypothetical protein